MKLYANGILLNAAAQSVTLEKSRGDAAATLTAVLLTAAADRYFPKESLALGDAVRLLGDAGEEVFLGAVQAVSRNVETVTLIACDRGLYLTANELSGVFAGSPEGICRAVAMRLSLPVGTLEVPAGWKRLVAGAGVRAFDILRQAVGEDREISIQNSALTVTKAGQERFVIAEETVLASRGTADARQMVNRCAVIDRRGGGRRHGAEHDRPRPLRTAPAGAGQKRGRGGAGAGRPTRAYPARGADGARRPQVPLRRNGRAAPEGVRTGRRVSAHGGKAPLGARAVHDRADLGGRGMNVYSELWALLRPEKSLDGGGALFGTLAGLSPLTVRVGGCEVSEGLFRPAGMSLRAEDVGRTLALLPCEEGFLLLFFVE